MQCCLHGWSFLLTTWLQLSKNCSSSRFLHMFRSSRNRAGRRSQVRADVFFSFTEFPDPPSLFFSSGRISRLVPQSFLSSFLSVCSLSYVFLPFPSRSSIKRSSLFHSSTAPTPPPLCLSLARLCRNFALLDQLSLSPSPQLQRCTTITIGRTGTQVLRSVTKSNEWTTERVIHCCTTVSCLA